MHSLPHGAGRRYSRKDAEERFKNHSGDLTRTEMGSHVVCRSKALLYQEAPGAYKDIDEIINYLGDFGVRIIAIFKPVLTLKT